MMPVSQDINIARSIRGIANIPRAVMNAALPDNSINICHMNAQSLCARQSSKFEEFKTCFVNSKIDLICVTETWLHEGISESTVAVEGYHMLRIDRKHCRGGGICLYHKSDILCKIIDASNDSFENRTEYMLVEIRMNYQRFLLGVFYCPPGIDCSNVLEQKLADLSLSYSNVVLIGDFNTNLKKDCARSNRFREVLNSFGLFCINNEPTHFFSGGSSLIDLILTNNSNFVRNFNQVAAPGFSQHDIIFSSLNLKRSRENIQNPYRDYNRINFDRLEHTLTGLDWSLLYSISDSDLALDFFNLRILELFEYFVPLRYPRQKSNALWFNDNILHCIIARDVAYRQWITTRSDSDHTQFRRLRNKVTSMVNKAKSDYIVANLDSRNTSKELWKKLKQMNVVSGTKSNTKFVNTCDEINAYFGENFTQDSTYCSIPPLIADGFSFAECNEADIISAIFSISSNATGLDAIPLRFIKLILPFIINPIMYLFNLFINTSKFPLKWKTAKIIPIPKKSAGVSLSNLRPISILCALSKVFERILKCQIQEYVRRFNLLSPYQSGFRSGHSTSTALLKVHDDISQFIDKKGVAFLLLIDFSKAFDRVSHVKLLNKLSQQFHFSRNAVLLIKSYLSLRCQIVEIDGNQSRPIHIISGVPQGSVLGPLLFSLFINDLPSVLKICMIHMFADDVQLYFCSTNIGIDEMVRLINADLKNVSLWSLNNLLPINSSKTKAMFISRRLVRPTLPHLVINNERIEYVNKASNLGVTFQNNLEWDDQVNSQCGKIYAGLRHLKFTAGMLPTPTKVKLFKTLLLPHLSYGLELILNVCAASYNRLRVALNHCIRWVFNLSRYSSVTHLQRELLGCSYPNYFKLRCCLAIHKIIHQGPRYLADKMQSFRSLRVQHYVISHHSTSHYGDTFFVRAIFFWNQLPSEIKAIDSYTRFHRLCLNWLNGENY